MKRAGNELGRASLATSGGRGLSWRAALAGFGFLVVVLAGGLALGLGDPGPRAALSREWAAVTLSAEPSRRVDVALAEPPGDWTRLSLRVAHPSATGDFRYGIAVGDGAEQLEVWLSPLGYTAVQYGTAPTKITLFPWRHWPHLGADANEIWLLRDGDSGGLSVWINREWLVAAPHRVGPRPITLFAAGLGDPAALEVTAIAVFH